jgi:hypothetical protein
VRVQLHQLISPGHRGGLDMRKEQMSRNLIHRERPKRSQRERARGPDDWTARLRRAAVARAAHAAARTIQHRTMHE